MEFPNTNFKMLNLLLSNTTSSSISMLESSPTTTQENILPPSFTSNQSKKRNRKRQKKVTFAENHQSFTKNSQVGTSTNELAETLFVDDNGTDTMWDDSHIFETAAPAIKNKNDTSISSTNSKSHPIILKKRDQPYSDPIKNLPFSPSRFLNPNSMSSQTEKDKVTKDLNLSLCSHPDDSGIETTCENDIFAKALTSTPISKKPREGLSPNLKSEIDVVSPLKYSRLSESCFSEANTTLFKHSEITSIDSGNETVFKTPLIRKYLNESGPRTPTPFKCEGKTLEKTMECNSNFDTFSLENFSILNEDKPLPIVGIPSPDTAKFGTPSHRVRSRSLKKARKALLLDQEWLVQEPKPVPIGLKDDPSLATHSLDIESRQMGFIPFESPMSKGKIRVHNCSSLVDDGTVVESRKFKIGRRSFYTSHSDIVSRKDEVCKKWKSHMEMNKKWVAIACGRSEAQKAMTQAAKKYLRSDEHLSCHKLTLSDTVLRKRAFQSTLMR